MIKIKLKTKEFEQGIREISSLLDISISEEGITLLHKKGSSFSVKKQGNECQIIYRKPSEFFRGLTVLCALLKDGDVDFERIEKTPFETMGIMIDCSRNGVLSSSTVKEYIRYMALLGYDSMQLYTEDIYELEGEPLFGYFRGKYSVAELKDFVRYGKLFGIELVPCIQTLAHLNGIFRWRHFDNIRDCDDILLADSQETYDFVDKMLKTCKEIFGTRRINIGMDEAHNVGRGRYYDIHGDVDKYEIILRHLDKVIELCKKYDFEPMMWSDMYFRLSFEGSYYPQNLTQRIKSGLSKFVPDGVKLVYWDYYHIDEKMYDHLFDMHFELCGKERTVFAGGFWTWSGFAPNIRFTNATTISAVKSATRNGIKDLFFTIWGNTGGDCAWFNTLPSLVIGAQECYGAQDMTDDITKLLTGLSQEEFSVLELPNLPDEEKVAHTNNISKYLLYSDAFMGFFDNLVKEGKSTDFAKNAQIIDKIGDKAGKWEYLFRTESALCRVMEIKYDLGVRTRRAYKDNNVDEIKKLISDYALLTERLEEFYKRVRYQWFKENKPYGFEVQDVRIGGLIQRTKHLGMRLEEYLNQGIFIPELNEEIINIVPECDKEPGQIICNRYLQMVSPSELQ